MTKPKRITYVSDWMLSKGRKTAAYADMRPGKDRYFKDENGLCIVNTFEPPSWSYTESTSLISHLIYHFEYLLPNVVEHNLLLDLIAWKIQHPDQRASFALIIYGPQGVGKSFIKELLNALFQHQYVSAVELSDIYGTNKAQYDSDWKTSLFLVIEELYASGKYDFVDDIKNLITARDGTINQKYGPKQKANYYFQIIVNSNSPNPIPIKDQDRRWTAVATARNKELPEHYKTLFDELDNPDFLAQTWWWLMRRDVSQFNPNAIYRTPARQSMVAESEDINDTIVKEFVSKVCEDDSPGFATYACLIRFAEEHYGEFYGSDDTWNPKALKAIFRKLPFREVALVKARVKRHEDRPMAVFRLNPKWNKNGTYRTLLEQWCKANCRGGEGV